VMKGPNYWKPEPKLLAMLTELAAHNRSVD
jgi:hypothetical protein